MGVEGFGVLGGEEGEEGGGGKIVGGEGVDNEGKKEEEEGMEDGCFGGWEGYDREIEGGGWGG